jgi:phosphohistidine phosphatase SixA
MRHAQKDENQQWDKVEEFRPLTYKGVRCAMGRANWLSGKGVVAVYANETVRTLATGMAISLVPDVEIVGDDKTRQSTIGKHLREQHPSPEGGKTAILIVAQSNEIRKLLLAFRADAEKCLDDSRLNLHKFQYGDLWIIDLKKLDNEGLDCEAFSREDPLKLGIGDENNCETK